MVAHDGDDAPAVEPTQAWRRATRTALDGAGAYVRDEDGTWHETLTGDVVPGARDLTLADLFDPPIEDRPEGAVRIVPRAWARRHPDHPLAWVFEHADLGTREPVAVPVDEWDRRAALPVAMTAPELHPLQLLGVDDVAARLEVNPATVRAYLARGQMPDPVVRIGGSPVWPRAVIERWAGTRRERTSAATTGGTVPPTADGAVGDER